MKTAILAIAFCTAMNAQVGATSWPIKAVTATRTFSTPGHFYVIKWAYDPNIASVPATYPPGPPHYHAKVSVFEVLNGTEKQIGKDFSGDFTNGLCYEDKPEDIVKSAIERAAKTDKK